MPTADLQSSQKPLTIANRDEIVSHYKRLRAAGLSLNSKLMPWVGKDAIDESARKLGMLQGGTIVFSTEEEAAVLMDYSLYEVRRKGRNAIEQYLANSRPDLESDEMMCLRAMRKAFYSLFLVESVERGLGVVVRDLLSNGVVLIVDMGFGSSAHPGLVFASRLLPHDGFTMTSGAALPIGVMPADQRDTMTEQIKVLVKPKADGYFDPAPLIRECLRSGCSSRVQFQDPPGTTSGHSSPSGHSRATAIGRNSPCPCGSGKKFKHCCKS